MNFEEFKEQFIDDVKKQLGENGIVASLETHEVSKLNESYEAITVTPEGSNVGVNVNVDRFFEVLKNGTDSFLVIYNSKKVLTTGGGKFLVGSALIVKGTNKGIAFLDKEDVEEAKAEFESRLATLCGSGIQFSAYEIC